MAICIRSGLTANPSLYGTLCRLLVAVAVRQLKGEIVF